MINTVHIGGRPRPRRTSRSRRGSACARPSATRSGSAGSSAALRTFPFLRELADDIAAVCPGRRSAQLHEPDGDEHRVPGEGGAGAAGRSASATPSSGRSHDLCELLGVPHEEVTWTSAGVNHQAWVLRFERNGENLYPGSTSGSRRTRSCGRARPRRHVPAPRLLPHRDERALQRVRALVPARRRRDRAAAAPGRRLPAASAPTTCAESERRREPRGRRGRRPCRDGATEYAPQVIHSMVTGTPRRIQVNVANTGLISNLPAGCAVEVPAAVDAAACTRHVGDLPAAVRGAQPHLPERGRAPIRRGAQRRTRGRSGRRRCSTRTRPRR